MLIGNAIVIVSLFGVSLVSYFELSSIYALISILIFSIGFGLAAGPITWLYLSDILPPIGVGVCTMNVWIFTILVGYFFPYINDNYGITTCFIIFTTLSLIGMIFIYFTIKETKGKTLK